MLHKKRLIHCISLSHIAILCFLIIYSSSIFAKGDEPKGVFSFVLENDVCSGQVFLATDLEQFAQ
jgi:hypothetical protein